MSARRTPAPGGRCAGPGRAVVVLAALSLILESSLYAASVPLLPDLAARYGLSSGGSGVLAAAYPAGALSGSVLGGWLVGRIGLRRASGVGFAAMVVGSVGFALAATLGLVLGARFAQGIGSGLVWAGVLTWLIAAAGPRRRGQAVGGALGAAVFGTLVGPLIGAVAGVAGIRGTFVVVAAVAGVIGAVVVRAQASAVVPPAEPGVTGWRDWRLGGLVLVNLMPGIFVGTVFLLVPLRLAELGASSTGVGAVFLVAAAVSAVLSPWVGRRCDRGETVRLLVVGLLVLALGIPWLAVPTSPVVLGVVTVALSGAVSAVFVVPSMTLLSARAQHVGMAAGVAAAMLNLTFSGGELLGAPLAGFVAGARSDVAAYALPAVMALLIVAVFGVDRRQARRLRAAEGAARPPG